MQPTNTSGQRRKASKRRRAFLATGAAPLYITVAPPNAGKTTWLENLHLEGRQQTLEIVCLDDMPEVYTPVPIKYWIDNDRKATRDVTANATKPVNTSDQQLLDTIIFDRTIGERIRQQSELGLVLQTLHSSEQGAGYIVALQQELETCNVSSSAAGNLAMVLANAPDVSNLQTMLPSHVDLFCAESLFRPAAETANATRTATDGGALDVAHARLGAVPRTTPVAWGNTNTLPRDYSVALQIASQQQRPVYFVVWGHDLPRLDLSELVRRNVQRLQRTGRYVPMAVQQSMLQRCEALLTEAQACNIPPSNGPGEIRLDVALAALAGYTMRANRTVAPSLCDRRHGVTSTPRSMPGPHGSGPAKQVQQQQSRRSEKGATPGPAWKRAKRDTL